MLKRLLMLKTNSIKTNDRINVCFYDHFKVRANFFFEQLMFKRATAKTRTRQGIAPHHTEAAVPEPVSRHPDETPDIGHPQP